MELDTDDVELVQLLTLLRKFRATLRDWERAKEVAAASHERAAADQATADQFEGAFADLRKQVMDVLGGGGETYDHNRCSITDGDRRCALASNHGGSHRFSTVRF